jgi:hypothetical protein
VDAIDKWMNFLEGHFRSTLFSIGKILLLHSLRPSPMLRTGGILTLRKGPQMNLQYLWSPPHGIL